MADIPFLNHVDLSNFRLKNVGNASADTDAPNMGQVRALVEGINWKDSARAASTANVTISGPGASIDGVTLANGDRVLLKDQTSQPENGIYIFNGAGSAMTRALDANTWDELEAATIRVEEGTNAGTKWYQTQVGGTLGTNNIVFASDQGSAPSASESTAGIAEFATQAEVNTGTDTTRTVRPSTLAGSVWAKKKFAQDIGDNSATSFNVDHNFNDEDVIVQVQRQSDGVYVRPDIQMSTANRVVLVFGTAPTNNQYRVICMA